MATIKQAEKIGTRKRSGLFQFLFLAMIFIQLPAFAAKTINLAWDASPDVNIVGYKVYYGTISGSYSNVVTVGNVTQAAIPGLIEGVTYYFAITAINSMNLESDPSGEVSYTVPIPVTLQMQVLPQNGVPFLAISASGTVSEQWMLESSVDLKIWTSFTNGTGPINIQVPIVGEPNRFFRLKNQ